ncbi:MAG: YdeI/OmpD-associated family protein [Gemmatimonadota bacterium]|nr:YdeI/OmpD-associated family protein [Gemmatimonadota bacterium]
MKSGKTDEVPILSFVDQKAWHTWLDKSHATSSGIWILFGKKNSGIKSVTYLEALDVALAFGWIDSQKRSHDETHFLQKFTPRGKRSIWSVVNRAKAVALIESGDMNPAGLAEVERARSDGRWEAAYEPQAKAQVPPDLQLALDANPVAAKFFTTLSSQNRYAILFRVHTARKPETRAKRIEQFVAMLARHETIHR